jgi:hypothetical protein
MGAWRNPVGPLSAWVYWVRRAVVALAILVVIALIVVLAVAISGTLQPGAGGVSAAPPTAASETPSDIPAVVEPVASPTPTGPVACDPNLVALTIKGYDSIKVSASSPKFALTATNTGQVACILDISGANYNLTVKSGNDLIWTTAHCAEWVPNTNQVLDPGAAVEFSITWKLRRSGQDCEIVKGKLKPGTYVATVTYMDVATARKVMLLTK